MKVRRTLTMTGSDGAPLFVSDKQSSQTTACRPAREHARLRAQ